MKNIRKYILLIIIIATVGFFIIRINTSTPTGAIRYECLLQDHIFSALFLQTKEFKIVSDRDKMVYKITFAIPYEKSTATHLYVCNKENEELHRHITFRDYLRQHKEERNKYSAVKKVMALKYPYDIDSYIEGKQPVILEIYKRCGLLI